MINRSTSQGVDAPYGVSHSGVKPGHRLGTGSLGRPRAKCRTPRLASVVPPFGRTAEDIRQ